MQSDQTPMAVHDDNIATAPGDLPMPEVQARIACMRTQFRHDNTISPLAPVPDSCVEVFATAGVEVPLRHAAVFFTTDGSPPSLDSRSVPMAMSALDWFPQTGYVRSFRAEIPGQNAGCIVRYKIGGWSLRAVETTRVPDIWARDGQGFGFKVPAPEAVTTFAFRVAPPRPPLPDWMRNAVIYHIFVDRFHPGNADGRFPEVRGARERHGGNLEGIRSSLPYLEELGVTCLWLSPIQPSTTYHRYDGEDFYGIDPALGSESDFRRLVEDLHGRGMRIWLDFVPSHSSWKHPAFLAAQRSRDSDTYGWYTFLEWPYSYRNFLQTSKYLPSLNLEDAGARAYVIDSAVHWLRDYSVDGFRLDHAIAPSMDFWTAFMGATQAARPDVVNVGEATDTPDSLRRFRGRLHGLLDFELARVTRLAFGAASWNVETLDTWLHAYTEYMAEGPGRVSFLDNHDMDRFLWVAGNRVERLKLAALFQFTLSPTPVVYYGTEIGLTQSIGSAESGFGGDENARGDMCWDSTAWNQEVLDFYKTLVRLRHNTDVLATGRITTVHTGSGQNSYAYLRHRFDVPQSGDILVLMNLGDEAAQVTLPPHLIGCIGDAVARTGDVRAADESLQVGGWSGAAFLLR